MRSLPLNSTISIHIGQVLLYLERQWGPMTVEDSTTKQHYLYKYWSNLVVKGDSGGPMTVEESTTKQHYLVGVVSWGDKCATVSMKILYH